MQPWSGRGGRLEFFGQRKLMMMPAPKKGCMGRLEISLHCSIRRLQGCKGKTRKISSVGTRGRQTRRPRGVAQSPSPSPARHEARKLGQERSHLDERDTPRDETQEGRSKSLWRNTKTTRQESIVSLTDFRDRNPTLGWKPSGSIMVDGVSLGVSYERTVNKEIFLKYE